MAHVLPRSTRRRVPLARRALFQDRRRAALAAGGVAAALLLVLLLDGIVAGGMRQVTAYLRSTPADVIVSQEGVKTMHMSVSSLPAGVVEEVRAVNGVAWAEGLHFASTSIASSQGRELSYVFGYDPGGRLGPRRLAEGRAPAAGEALVDGVAADRIGVGVGDAVIVFGEPFTISGLFDDGTSMINTTTFITAADYVRLRGPSVAYVFAGAEPGTPDDALVERIASTLPSATVQTRDRFVREEAAIVGDMAADLMQIMSIVGFLIALAVIGLTLFTLTLSKLREHAVMKALGSRNRGVGAVVLTQAVWSVGIALALATVLAILIGGLVGRADPSLLVTIEASSVLRAGIGALVVGALGSIVPLRRVFRVDPATAFRRAS
jgi:putative ABC transport system permease protein